MKSVRFNYIPHKTPINVNYDKWYLEYKDDITQMFFITIDILREKYPDITKLNLNKKFQTFCKMIFKSSSKFIFKDYYYYINNK